MFNKHIVASLIKVIAEYFSDYKWKKKTETKKQFYVKMVTNLCNVLWRIVFKCNKFVMLANETLFQH